MARLRAVPRPPKPLLLALAVIGVPLLALGLRVLLVGGAFRAVTPEFAGNCHAIGLGGSGSDIRIDRERGVAYLSLRDRDSSGTVTMLDLNLAEPAPRAAMSFDPPGFRPEGISLLKPPGRPALLFAVSHARGGVPGVEISEQGPDGAFVPRRTVRDPAFGNAGLVAAVGPSTFFVVDHRPPQGGLLQKWRLLTRTGDDSLVSYDGEKAAVAVKDLAWVSGLAASADGSQLYVAEALQQQLRIYHRDGGQLTLERTVALDVPPGGLDVDAEGVIWMTAHPRLLRYFSGLRDARERAPTQVLRFDPRASGATPQTVFTDDGAWISAGTVAAHWRNEFLIGALFDKKVLICQSNP